MPTRFRGTVRLPQKARDRNEYSVEITPEAESVRSFAVKNFNAFYVIDEPLKTVSVLRVMYNRRDV